MSNKLRNKKKAMKCSRNAFLIKCGEWGRFSEDGAKGTRLKGLDGDRKGLGLD